MVGVHLQCRGVQHTHSPLGGLRCPYTRTRLEAAFSERADSSQSITGLACQNDMPNHFPSPKTIFHAIKEVALMAQSRWGASWEADENCFTGKLKCALRSINKVINKPNYSKFRSTTDNPE